MGQHGVCRDCTKALFPKGTFSFVPNSNKVACCYCGDVKEEYAVYKESGEHRSKNTKYPEPLCGWREEDQE